ncbi:MAG: hypothetical protein Q9183_007959 [Haloplaca sp. 2 TL-2023]
MALRNELRDDNGFLWTAKWITWDNWYGNMTDGAAAVHAANPDLLIYFSGMNFDEELRDIFTRDGALAEKGLAFSTLPYVDKIVLEVHNYDMTGTDTDCESKLEELTYNAFLAQDESSPEIIRPYPVVMTEWGHAQNEAGYASVYSTCLRDILPQQQVSWMVWVLGGSYYIRQGVQDYDETWGLLDHTWKNWRCPECIASGLQPMVANTLSSVRGTEPVEAS